MSAVVAPEPLIVKRWRCPFCHRSRSSKRATAEHIARCWLNPAARSCKTCAHYEYDPGGDWCFPGRPCNCNDGGEECSEGMDLTRGLLSGCLFWSAVLHGVGENG